jgi:gliding motility-associated-like protein
MALDVADAGTRGIQVSGSIIMGATDNGFQTIRLGTGTRAVDLSDNRIERCYQAIYFVGTDSIRISNNLILNSNFGITADNFSEVTEISGNRLLNILSQEDEPEGTAAISVQNASSTHIFNNFIQTAGNGPVFAIDLQSVTSCRISFNSVNITNNDPQGLSTGIRVTGNASEVIARNNIFNVSIEGIPVDIETAAPQLDFDRNDYFSFDGTIGYFTGSRYISLQEWQNVSGMDLNSVTTVPFFSSDTDLSINHVLLNNAGIPIAGITTDIDGNLRNATTPDIGAKEYIPCATDAGINAVLSPVNPLTIGSHPVTVELQNQGTAALSSATINWQVNGQNQPAFDWSGNLAAGSNAEVEIGQFDFQSGNLYVITAWTSNPNGTSDCNNNNDQVNSRNLAAPLCGTYTIGGSTPDFASFNEAVTVLNEAGIDCAVTFMVRDGFYFERLVLGNVPGTSESSTITFMSESGDSTLAVLKILPQALKKEALLRLEGTRHLTISGLGLSTGATDGTVNNAIFMDGASEVVVENCQIKAINESDVGIDIQAGSHGIMIRNNRMDCPDLKAGAINIEGVGTRDVEIAGNHITGSFLRGNTLFRIYNGPNNISITGNRIERAYRSLFIGGADSITVRDNFFNNTHDGIYVIGTGSHFEISANRLTNIRSHQNAPEGTSGIIFQNITGIEIVNNFIHTVGTGPVLGINLQQVDSCRVLYNSVTIANTDAQGRSKGLYLTGTSGIVSKDNIFNVITNGIPAHIDVDVVDFIPDYNNYYHPLGVIGKIENTTYDDLFDWGLAVNGDANSMAVDPYFAGDTIPLPFQRALNGAGIPIPGILTDIDGKLRFAQAPDVGCVEFTVDYGVLELLSPDLNCYHDDSDSVTVYLKMFGDVPFNDLKVAYKLDNGPVHIDTIPGPVFGDIIHTFETVENISAEGDYLFTIWLINTLDDNINNDTLKAWRYSKPIPVATISYDNFCTGWTVSYFGSATVEAPYFIESFEWLFGDGETSLEQNPVHEYPEPGTYEVTLQAYSDAGCYGFTTMEIFIDPNFLGLSMDYTLVNETCYRDSTGSLDIVPSGGYPPYTVYLNDHPVSSNPVTGITTGTYMIRIEDSENCTVSDTVEAFSTVFLDPQIEANPLSGMTPLTVDFSFTANNPVSWIWFFPGSDFIDTDTSKTPSYTFIDFGTHQVILEVTGGHPYYCVERDTVEIFVDIIVTIDVNTVFTPNGDGFNDFFEIKTTAVRELNAKIFNRWGNKVYEIEEVNGKWDGNTEGGAELPDGTYFFDIQAIGYDDKDYNRSGAVLLLRHAAQAYPNPVSSRVKVEVFGPIDPPVSFEAYSVFGQVALAGSLNDPGNIDIDLSTLSKGIYMLKVFDKNRHYYVRIIKN